MCLPMYTLYKSFIFCNWIKIRLCTSISIKKKKRPFFKICNTYLLSNKYMISQQEFWTRFKYIKINGI
ncbi:hypothetical protein C0J52_27744 [Blattella germanica]|nr:hypothetical protein C0J52_27744 [Blattella germanica]